MNSRHRLIVLLSIVLSASIGGIAQPADNSHDGIGATVRAISHGLADYRADEPTLLFGMPAGICVSCAGASVNSICMEFARRGIPINALVVVTGAGPREGPSIRRMFKYGNVLFNVDSSMTRELFGPKLGDVHFIYIDTDGRVLASVEDLQHNPLEPSVFDSLLTISGPANYRLLGTVELQDNDEPILEVVGPSYDARRHEVTFLDINSNRISTFDVQSGARRQLVAPSDSISYGLRPRGQDEAQWKEFLSVYPAPVKLFGILRPSHGDSIFALADVVSRYVMSFRPHGDSAVNWESRQCLVTFVDGHAMDVVPIPDELFNPLGTFHRLGSRGYISQGVILPPRRLPAKAKLNLPNFWYFDVARDTLFSVCDPTRMLKMDQQNALHSGVLCVGDSGQIFHLSGGRLDVWKANFGVGAGPDAVIPKFRTVGSIAYADSSARYVGSDVLWANGELFVLSIIVGADSARGGFYLDTFSSDGTHRSRRKLALPDFRVARPSLLSVDGDRITSLVQAESGSWYVLNYGK